MLSAKQTEIIVTTDNLPMRHASVLVWLSAGTQPTASNFHASLATAEPPKPNPEAWWELRQAIIYAVELENKHGKEPWIKVGGSVLAPADIAKAYRVAKGSDNA